ncbi:MAG: hypothetical protein JSR82_22790 [Verrucomicrobia bacterium]|nr:hypothetical protein [Verrucomicrobiota bacterium]
MLGKCALCERETEVTRHHLIPQCRHGKRSARLRYDREQLKRQLIAPLCRPCHKQVHAVLTEKELERDFPTIEALRAHPDLARFVAWVRQRPPGASVVVRPMKRR